MGIKGRKCGRVRESGGSWGRLGELKGGLNNWAWAFRTHPNVAQWWELVGLYEEVMGFKSWKNYYRGLFF